MMTSHLILDQAVNAWRWTWRKSTSLDTTSSNMYACASKNCKNSSPLQQQQQFMVIDDMHYVYAYESMNNNNNNEIMLNLLKRSFVCNVASMWFVPLWATKSSYIIIIVIIIMTIIIIIIVKMQLSLLQHENQRRSGHAFSLITHELCVILRNYYITLIFLVLHTTS